MDKRTLTSKEAALFKELLTLYETRQTKKGIKTADLILKKFPEHGETLAMKGLLLVSQGDSAQGLTLVKQGVRNDLTSHICWHVLGIVQKQEKKYEDALKSYLQALRFDKENLNLLRDTAQLQVHLRLYDGLVETRTALLKTRPIWRTHWIGLAVAYDLAGKKQLAANTLKSYHNILTDRDDSLSETLLYQASLQPPVDALDTLESTYIINKTARLELKAKALSSLGRTDDAERFWKQLLDRNPDSQEYLQSYLANLGVTSPSQILSVLPESALSKRVSLFLDPAQFLQPYITTSLQKGIPSLFVSLRPLYPTHAQLIHQTISAVDTSTDPAVHLWKLYFLAQHHSILDQPLVSLRLLNEMKEHTPTLPEIYILHSQILETHFHSPLHSAEAMNAARLLDLQDRYLNNQSITYLLRAGLFPSAAIVASLFTKRDAASPEADLEDMQSREFLIESAKAHLQSGELTMALKRFSSIVRIYTEISDDQFDFHSYSLRKFILLSYTQLIHWEDTIRLRDPVFAEAVLSSVKIWIKVFDEPNLKVRRTKKEEKKELSEAEKKARKKAKKAQAAAAAHQNHTTDGSKTGGDVNKDAKKEEKEEDDDPDGYKAFSCEDPLERANKVLSPLLAILSSNPRQGDEDDQDPYEFCGLADPAKKRLPREVEIDVWCAGYDLAVRRSRPLQALRALFAAFQLGGQGSGLVHERLADLALRIRDAKFPPQTEKNETVKATIDELILKLSLPPQDVGLDRWNIEWLQKAQSSPSPPTDASALLSYARVARLLGTSIGEIEKSILEGFNSLPAPPSASAEGALALNLSSAGLILTFLTSELGSSAERIAEFRDKLRSDWIAKTGASETLPDDADCDTHQFAVPVPEILRTPDHLTKIKDRVVKGVVPVIWYGAGEDP